MVQEALVREWTSSPSNYERVSGAVGATAPTQPGQVIIVCPGGLENGGGIGRQMGYFLQESRQRGGAVRYSVADSRGPWFLGGAARSRSVMSLFYFLCCLTKLTAAGLRSTHGLVHINIAGRGSTLRKVVLALAAKTTGLRYVLHVHDYDYAADYLRRGWPLRAAVKRIFHYAERVIVLGSADKTKLQQHLQITAEKVVVLHNAAPDPNLSAEPKYMHDEVQLLFLGYLSERKGVIDLLEALGNSSVSQLPWRAVLAGGGDIKAFQGIAKANGVDSRVQFPGWLNWHDVQGLCLKSDILILPSYAEGLAMAVLEGLSYGLAIITTPVGAHTEVIQPGLSGILVPPGDKEALAEAICDLIKDSKLRTHLQIGARAQFLEKFNIGSYTDRLSKLHREILTDAGR